MTANLNTGEMFDLTVEEDLREAYNLMKEQASNLKRFKKEVDEAMKAMLDGKASKKIVSSIFELKAVKTERRSYPISALKKCFDEDQLMTCVKPINKKVDELMYILSPEDKDELTNSMVVDGTSTTYKIV